MPSKNSWTQEEDDLLRALYPDTHNDDLVAHFTNRTASAINMRAYKFGIKKSEAFWKAFRPTLIEAKKNAGSEEKRAATLKEKSMKTSVPVAQNWLSMLAKL